MQALGTSPDDPTAQSAVVSAAPLTQQLNSMSNSIQSLRSRPNSALSEDVTQANNGLQQIAQINQQWPPGRQNIPPAALEDQRDGYIDQLSKLMDVRVINADNNQVSLLTTSACSSSARRPRR